MVQLSKHVRDAVILFAGEFDPDTVLLPPIGLDYG